MASALYENVGEWHTNVESKDMLSSDEIDPFDFKGDAEDRDDEYEEVSPKQNSLTETPENNSLVKTETTKENGHDYSGMIGNVINGNGVHEVHDEDPRSHDDRHHEGNEEDYIAEDKVNGEDNYSDTASAEANEDDRAPAVPFYGRTLVAPEYMNFQFEETSQREEKAAGDDNDNEIAVADESDDLGSPRAEEETPGQAFQKEVLEEDDITLSEEESDEDEDGNVEEEDQRLRADYQVEDEHEEEEQEEEEEDEEHREEEEGKEEEDTAGESSKYAPKAYSVCSPQLAQAEDDEDEDEEENEYVEVQEGSSLKEDGEVEEQESTEEDGQQATQSKSSLQLIETDDDEEHDEEIDKETTNECNLKHSDSLKVQRVTSPTPNVGEVGSVAESFVDGEGVTTEDYDGDKLDPGAEQEFTIEDRSFNITDDQREERRKTFNGPVQEFENQGNKHVEGGERDDDSCQSDDTEEDSSDETVAIEEAKDKDTCDDEGGVDLDTIPEGVDVEGNSEAQDEEYSVHISSQEQGNESDLAGKVKELGRMFEGGGPVFPKTVKNDIDTVDGSPVSVRRYKAIFEQDQLSAERAREPGRREELTGPPRGIVKNLRGLFENPQGFEARKG